MTIAFLAALGILLADFADNGVIDNQKFLIISLFVFSGAGTGRAIDAVIERYIGKQDKHETDRSSDER